ncbi:MAG: 2,3-bisphosphoglycerate-independent phosphoglycerate mutase [Candidatus Paceibacterota bacterium]
MNTKTSGVLLIVLDGFGIAPSGKGNAISLAKHKNIQTLEQMYPHTTLSASGESVGLPAHEAGNTEVGHINLGAGRIIYQSLPRINMSIADGSFFENAEFVAVINHVKKHKSNLHVMGLLGNGTVHASNDHLYALLQFFREQSVNNIFIHSITDGRDSPPQSAETYLKQLQNRIERLNIGTIASIMGRYYAMDRDLRWDRVEKAYLCLTQGKGQKAESWKTALEVSYKNGKSDEFILPTNITRNGKPVALVQPNDGIIFYNYRIDRPRELTKAFVLDDFRGGANKVSYDPYAIKYYKKHEVEQKPLSDPFNRGKKLDNLYFVTMTEYDKAIPAHIAYPPRLVRNSFGEVIAHHDIRQLRLAESEKERFVTFYFNGRREKPFIHEDRLIEPSPKVPTYDKKPEMSAYKLLDVLTDKLKKQNYKFILCNFANPDMVGHTGNLKAGIQAIQVIDDIIGKLIPIVLQHNYVVFITADHGNVEEMLDSKTGKALTEHTANPVPLFIISKELKGKSIVLQRGILADVAPTMLSFLNIPKPDEMTGRNLIEELM